MKFTDSGDVIVKIQPEEESQQDVLIRFEVSDTGIGVPTDAHVRLFESFSQVDASTTRKYGGTGLGLAISKRLAELMGGSIGVKRHAETGSTFWFTVRVAKWQSTVKHVNRTRTSIDGMRLLYVDRYSEARNVVVQQFECWGGQVDVVEDGREALERLQVKPSFHGDTSYDLILLSDKLSDMDGTAAAVAIRTQPALMKIPVLILQSVELNSERDVDLLMLENVSYTNKPLRFSRVYDVLNESKRMRKLPSSALVQHSEGRSRADSPNVLLAEDNSVNQLVSMRILEKFGCRVEVVTNGRDVLRAHVDRGCRRIKY